jgi:hypothetical protein
MILIRPATLADAQYVGARLRADDEREVQTSTGQPGTAVVPLAFQTSRECYTVWCANPIPRFPIALFGVADNPKAPSIGVVWFLGTEELRLKALSMIRESKPWLNHMSRLYPDGLHNIADKRNDLHLRWCQLTGFNLGLEVQVNGEAFIHIYRPTPNV